MSYGIMGKYLSFNLSLIFISFIFLILCSCNKKPELTGSSAANSSEDWTSVGNTGSVSHTHSKSISHSTNLISQQTSTSNNTSSKSSKTTFTSVISKLQTTSSSVNRAFLSPEVFNKGRDAYGGKSISIIGDSISHGANAPDIPEESYVARLKKSLAAQYGVYNYGYTSLSYSIYNKLGVYNELHTVKVTDGIWNKGADSDWGSYPGYCAYKSQSESAAISITVDTKYKGFDRHINGFFLYYAAGPDKGTFTVEVGGKTLASLNCYKSSEDKCARSAFIALPADAGDKVVIDIIKGTNKPIIITGIGYAENPLAVTVNNYSLTGTQLVNVSDDVLKSVCKANVVMLALGFNDAGYQADKETFKNKINVVIKSCKESGAKLIVLDTLWRFEIHKEFYRSELLRASNEADGKYISFTTEYEDNPNMISDGAHPSVRGHYIIARKICKELGIPLVM